MHALCHSSDNDDDDVALSVLSFVTDVGVGARDIVPVAIVLRFFV